MPILQVDYDEFEENSFVSFEDRLTADYNDIGEIADPYEYGADDYGDEDYYSGYLSGSARFCFGEDDSDEESLLIRHYAAEEAHFDRDMWNAKIAFDSSARRKPNGSWVYGMHEPIGFGLPSSAQVEAVEERPLTPSFGSHETLSTGLLFAQRNWMMSRSETRNKPDQTHSARKRFQGRRKKGCKKHEHSFDMSIVSFDAVLDSFQEFAG